MKFRPTPQEKAKYHEKWLALWERNPAAKEVTK